jgi:hypothetical protein
MLKCGVVYVFAPWRITKRKTISPDRGDHQPVVIYGILQVMWFCEGGFFGRKPSGNNLQVFAFGLRHRH